MQIIEQFPSESNRELNRANSEPESAYQRGTRETNTSHGKGHKEVRERREGTSDVGADRNLAYSHSIQRVAGTDKQGKKLDLTVRVTDVYQKIGRRWLIVHEHVWVPVDLGADKPDLASKP